MVQLLKTPFRCFQNGTIAQTFADYAAAAAAGSDPLTGKSGADKFPVVFDPNERLTVAEVTPAIHYCMGGLAYNAKGQILREQEGRLVPVKRLYGAGEVTGGLHGKNRLAGNSLLECATFGRIAGTNAAG